MTNDPHMPTYMPNHPPTHLRHQVIAEENAPFFGADLDAVLNVEPQPLKRRIELSSSVHRHIVAAACHKQHPLLFAPSSKPSNLFLAGGPISNGGKLHPPPPKP